jgi:Tfp pilus assembly protein PilN
MSINLLPHALAEAQREKRRKRLLFFIGLAILFLAFIVSVGSFGYRTMLSSQKRQLERTKALKLEELRDLQSLEESVVDISKRAEVLNQHFKNVKNYSILVDKVLASTFTGVEITDLSLLMNNRLNVVGSVQTYDSLSNFLDELLKADQDSQEKVFVSIDLQRVTSNPATGNREFDLDLEPNTGVFK